MVATRPVFVRLRLVTMLVVLCWSFGPASWAQEEPTSAVALTADTLSAEMALELVNAAVKETVAFDLAGAAPGEWHEPPVIRPHSGSLVELNVDTNRRRRQFPEVMTPRGPVKVNLRSYFSPQAVGASNGLVGPTFRVRANDTLRVRIDNTLLPNVGDCNPKQHDDPDCYDHTNFHTHGLHISPNRFADNVLIAIAPEGENKERCEQKPECRGEPWMGCCYKKTFAHQYRIGHGMDGGHYPGTFWYHAHKHGSTSVQLASGMAGALIVEDPATSPLAGFLERVMVLQQLAFDDAGEVLPKGGPITELRNNWGSAEEPKRYTTINGVAKPAIEMCPGEVQRWRIIDGGVFEMVPIELAWMKGDHRIYPPRVAQHVAIDGITMKKAEEAFGRAGGPLDPLPQPMDMGPGYRADLLVKDWPELRRQGYKLVLRKKAPVDPRMVFKGMSDAGRNQVLAEVVGLPREAPRCGSGYKTGLLAPNAPLPAPAQLEDISAGQVQGHRKVEFKVAEKPLRFLINNRLFDHKVNEEFCLPYGKKEEWTLTTAKGGQIHPFHIHVNAFQMVRDGKPAEWRDTILVKEGEELKMRTYYENFEGRFVLHCHILTHEDRGMMQLVEIAKSPAACRRMP